LYQINQADLYLSLFGLLICSQLQALAIYAKGSSLVIKTFVGIFFVQYFLTILIVAMVGSWSTSVISHQEINSALKFSLFCMISIIVGYSLAAISRRSSVAVANKVSFFKNVEFLSRNSQPTMNWRKYWLKVLFLIIFVVLILCLQALLFEGQLSAIFVSDLPRGFDQFESKTNFVALASVLFSLNGIFSLVPSLMLGLALGSLRGLKTIAMFPVILLLLVVCAAPLMHGFSRASGAAFIVAAVGLAISPRRSAFNAGLILLFAGLGLYFFVIGFTQRGVAPMGVLSFVEAAIWPNPAGFDWLMTVTPSGNWVIGPNINFFDAIGPLSASIHFSGKFEEGPALGFLWLIAVLQPLPSALIPMDYTPSVGLSTALGVWGSTGITTPAIAELHFLMGYWAIVPLFIYGWFLRAVDRGISVGGHIPLLIFLLTTAGIVVSGHSGLRAFGRPTILALILLFLAGRKYHLGPLCIDLRFRPNA
jgi:hypothetical protein